MAVVRILLHGLFTAMMVLGIAMLLQPSKSDAASYQGHKLDRQQVAGVTVIRHTWRSHGESRRATRRAVRVAWCESAFRIGVKNRHSTAKGLFQLLDYNRRRFQRGSGGLAEALAGLRMWRSGGRSWRAWSCG